MKIYSEQIILDVHCWKLILKRDSPHQSKSKKNYVSLKQWKCLHLLTKTSKWEYPRKLKSRAEVVLKGLLCLHAGSCLEVHHSWDCWQSEYPLLSSEVPPSAVTDQDASISCDKYSNTQFNTYNSLQWDRNLEQWGINVFKTAPQNKRNQLWAAKLGLGKRAQPSKATPICWGETGNSEFPKLPRLYLSFIGTLKKRQKYHSPASSLSPQTSSGRMRWVMLRPSQTQAGHQNQKHPMASHPRSWFKAHIINHLNSNSISSPASADGRQERHTWKQKVRLNV